MNGTFRTVTLIASALGLGVGLIAPAAHADPVEVVSTSVCLVDIEDVGSDPCTVPVDLPGVKVRAAGQCVGVLVEGCEP